MSFTSNDNVNNGITIWSSLLNDYKVIDRELTRLENLSLSTAKLSFSTSTKKKNNECISLLNQNKIG